jgi:hypothetical protein
VAPHLSERSSAHSRCPRSWRGDGSGVGVTQVTRRSHFHLSAGEMRPPPHHPGMDRHRFLVTSVGGALAASLVAEAQPAGKAARVAVLSPGPGPVSSWSALEAFRQRLQDLGYVEGRNLTIEWRFIAGNVARVPEVAAEPARLNVDVIVPINTSGGPGGETGHGEDPDRFRPGGRYGGL